MRITCFVFVFFRSVLSMRGMSVNNYVLSNSSGYIKSLNYPRDYPSSHATKWRIFAPPEFRIVLRFLFFDLEESTNCVYDSLKVYDAADIEDERLSGGYCGTRTPTSITSMSNSLTLFFKTDRTKQRPGFHLYYARLPADCSFNFDGVEGSIESPNFYGEYANDLRCRYTISFPKDRILSLDFIDFDLQSQNGYEICQDYIQIGRPNNGSRNRENYCGSKLPRSYTFYSGEAVFFFVTDSDITAAGFRANYTVLDIEDCLNTTQGLDYRGFTNVSSDGNDCLFWDSPLLLDHVNGSLIDEKNYCRNPNGLEKPWCYVLNNITNARAEYCDIPICGITTIISTESPTTELTTINQDLTTGQIPIESTRFAITETTERTYINIQRKSGALVLGNEITIPVVTLSCILILVLALAGIIVFRKIYRKKIQTKPDVRIRSVINPQYIASKDISNGYIVSYENTEIGNQINMDIRASLRRSQRKRRIQNGTAGKGEAGNTINNKSSGRVLTDINRKESRSNSANSNGSDGEARYSTILDLEILPEIENPYVDKEELYDVLRRQRTRRKKPEDESDYGSIIVLNDGDLYSHTPSFGRISTFVPNDSELNSIDDCAIYENGPSAGSSCTDIDIYSNDRERLVL